MAWCGDEIFSDEENLWLSLPPLQNPPMSSSSSYIHSRVNRRGKKIREVKMAAWSELWSVSLPSPVSPQPPLSVLPQPVVFQSIDSQPSTQSLRTARPLTISAHPLPLPPSLSSLSPFVPASSLPLSAHAVSINSPIFMRREGGGGVGGGAEGLGEGDVSLER